MLVQALVLFYCRLSRSQYRNRDPMGRSADIIEADIAAKLDRPRIASMLAADSNLYILFHPPRHVDSHFHESANSFGINALKGVHAHDPFFEVKWEELAFSILSAKAESSLSKVICAKANKISNICNLICYKAGSVHFNHSAKLYL